MAEQRHPFTAVFPLPDLAATGRLGARIRGRLRPGDTGGAGAIWARARPRWRAPSSPAWAWHEAVPSPTFTLVQSYETARLTISHYDLYRLKSARELDELGLEDALEQGAVLVEWPERAEGAPAGGSPDGGIVGAWRWPARGAVWPRALAGPCSMAERSPRLFCPRRLGRRRSNAAAGRRLHPALCRGLTASTRPVDGPAAGRRKSARAGSMPAKQSVKALGYNAVARLAGADTQPLRRSGGASAASRPGGAA
jgi:tRNA threonylcarbamoyladenosine biosynthesis protein TsaE